MEKTRKLFIISLAVLVGGSLLDALSTADALIIGHINGYTLSEMNALFYRMGSFWFGVLYFSVTVFWCSIAFIAEFSHNGTVDTNIKYAVSITIIWYSLIHVVLGINNIADIMKVLSVHP